jgi:hypothetical protein
MSDSSPVAPKGLALYPASTAWNRAKPAPTSNLGPAVRASLAPVSATASHGRR